MERILYKSAKGLYAALLILLCLVSKTSLSQLIIDPVCGMKVDSSESYDYTYGKKKYSFDSYDCRKAFMANPKKYIENACTPPAQNRDLVCGLVVDLSESFDLKYKNKIYYFHSKSCRKAFKMNPEKFINNKCDIPVSADVK